MVNPEQGSTLTIEFITDRSVRTFPTQSVIETDFTTDRCKTCVFKTKSKIRNLILIDDVQLLHEKHVTGEAKLTRPAKGRASCIIQYSCYYKKFKKIVLEYSIGR